MNSFKESFSANYIYTEEPDSKGKLKKHYVYCGNWYCFCDSKKEKSSIKLRLILCEIIGLISFILAGTNETELNKDKFLGLFVGLATIGLFVEIYGIVSFCVSKFYITGDDYKWIDGRIMWGAFFKSWLLIIGLVGAIAVNNIGLNDGFFGLLMYLLTIFMSFMIFRIQKKVTFHTFRNENGKVGNEY